MQKITWAIFIALISMQVSANGGAVATGTDDNYVREKAAQNPRNRSFPGSFKKIGQEPEEERMEDIRELEEFKDDPFIDNYGNGETNKKGAR